MERGVESCFVSIAAVSREVQIATYNILVSIVIGLRVGLAFGYLVVIYFHQNPPKIQGQGKYLMPSILDLTYKYILYI